MNPLLIDIGIVGIVVFCAWRGFRNGLIRGAFGFVALIVSLFLANTIAKAYAEEFTGVLTPFASGVIESALFGLSGLDEDFDFDFESIDLSGVDLGSIDLSEIDLSEVDLESLGLDLDGVDLDNLSLEDLDLEGLDLDGLDLGGFDLESFDINDISVATLDTVPEKYMAAFLALKFLGMTDAAADRIAQASSIDTGGSFYPVVVGDNLSLYLSYIALFGIAFLLISIIFTVIGNLIGVVLTLPGLNIIDSITGVAFGFLKGMIIILAIGVVIRYFAFLPILNEYVNGTTILYHIANNNMIADLLGV